MINRLLRARLVRPLALGCLALLAGFAACSLDERVPSLADASALVVAVRVSPITFNPDSDEHLTPFEDALLTRLAEHLKKKLEIVPLRSAREVIDFVAAGKAHLGAGWFFSVDDPRVTATTGFHADQMVVVQQDPSVAIDSVDDLSGKTVHVSAGSLAAQTLQRLRDTRMPSLTVIERPDGSGIGLLRSVADHEIELTVAPKELAAVAQNYFPETQLTAPLAKEQAVTWLTANRTGNDVLQPVNEFLAAITADGSLARLKDAHFAFRRRLTQLDSVRFIERMRTLLPQYHALFKQAQIRTGIDWRLVAALAYQESQWNPNAISPTNVRGMMMLTEDTADRLKVSNRLDARESILAGADYLASLRDELPADIEEPDRTWMALAAYNLGMGHLRGARSLAVGFKLNPDLWFDMKKMLPMLSRPEIYARLKSGRARGGEAVILVENVRAYYDILSRHEPAYTAINDEEAKPSLKAGDSPGLKLRPARPLAAPTSAASRM